MAFSADDLARLMQEHVNANNAGTSFDSVSDAVLSLSEVICGYMNRHFACTAVGSKNYVACLDEREEDFDRSKEEEYKLMKLSSFRDESPKIQVTFRIRGKESIHKVNFVKEWLENPHRRTAQLVFAPPGMPDASMKAKLADGRMINMYRGPGITREAAEAANVDDSLPFQRHLLENLCGGDQRVYEFLVKGLALKVQYPGVAQRWCLVMYGPTAGTGKSKIFRILSKIVGNKYSYPIHSVQELVGRFNSWMEKCVLGCSDEITYSNDPAESSGLRRIVSESRVAIEKKGIETYVCDTSILYIFITNNPSAWAAMTTERRALILRVTKLLRDDPVLESQLYALEENPLPIAKWLYSIDVSGFKPEYPPETEGLRDQIEEHMTPLQRWVANICQTGRIGTVRLSETGPVEVNFEEFQASYRGFVGAADRYHKSTAFRGLEELSGIRAGKVGRAQVAIRHIPSRPDMVATFRRAMNMPQWFPEYDCDVDDRDE